MPGTTFTRTAASIAFWIEDTSPAKLLTPGVEAAAGAEPLEEEPGPAAVSSEPRGCDPRGLSPVHATTVRLSASRPAPRPPRRPRRHAREACPGGRLGVGRVYPRWEVQTRFAHTFHRVCRAVPISETLAFRPLVLWSSRSPRGRPEVARCAGHGRVRGPTSAAHQDTQPAPASLVPGPVPRPDAWRPLGGNGRADSWRRVTRAPCPDGGWRAERRLPT